MSQRGRSERMKQINLFIFKCEVWSSESQSKIKWTKNCKTILNNKQKHDLDDSRVLISVSDRIVFNQCSQVLKT